MRKILFILIIFASILGNSVFAVETSNGQVNQNAVGVFIDFLNKFLNAPAENDDVGSNSQNKTNGLSPFAGSVTDINQLISPDTMSPEAANMMGAVAGCINNRAAYEEASRYTGAPWQVLAGIHYREGNCNPNASLVSGRPIGEAEPDMEYNCSSAIENGLAIPVNGGCGFATLTQSAIYAARHLIDKIGKVPQSFEELGTALSRYNGGGNSNCGKTPYPYCPPAFSGDDDPYPMALLDEKHKTMYVIYCEDGVANTAGCPRVDQNPGVLTAISLISFATK